MSSDSASNSGGSSISAYTRQMAFPKSHISVNLDNHFSSKIYTSSSPVSGNVTITTQRDVRFEAIEIVLLGTARTRVDGVSTPQASSHIFLKMIMPVPESTYPVPRVLENGRTYTIPFNFVIPSYLTINACGHRVDSEHVRDHHVCLPPTMGSWEKDDMTPQMATVEYSVKARVFREPDMPGKLIKVMEAVQEIQVLPTYPEQAPLSVTKQDKMYITSKTKSLRKSIISGKTGRLTVSAAQPGAVILRPDGKVAANTTAQVDLNFEPVSAEVLPPKVTSMSGKIEAHTFYSSGAITHLPNLGDWNRSFTIDRRGVYNTSVPLFSRTFDKLPWAQQLTAQVRRDSGYGSDSPGAQSDVERSSAERSRRRESNGGGKQMKARRSTPSPSPIYHTTTVQVPIGVPTDRKTFIPSFHACIVSRVYTLVLAVTVSFGSTTSTVTLRLPLQVAVEPAPTAAPPDNELPSFETAVQEAELDEFLRPRLLSVPDVQFHRGTLPGYPPAPAR
ncbi:Arrestin [Pleurostoma richardsiae]|uniref:Arrestin n=1 Tax=Pleurostoma richardsiae TaxID=41990 RepID=A0AA38R743_9PEZI|nr:Arrestin [Pleurostoma richardsiae]